MPVAEESRFFHIVKDYVGYKLRQNEISIFGYHENSSPSPASLKLRGVADELIAGNRQLFDSMCDQLHLTQNTAYPTFVGIADEVFQNGKNWGRIVAFLAFGANLAVHCAQREDLAGFVDNVVEWVVRYMDQNLSKWIDDNGGWDGFVIFFQTEDDEGNGSTGWRVAAVAGVGIGALLMLVCR